MKQKNQEEGKRKGHILISSCHTYRFLMINKTSRKNLFKFWYFVEEEEEEYDRRNKA
jgi:hypothetical protein